MGFVCNWRFRFCRVRACLFSLLLNSDSTSYSREFRAEFEFAEF